MNEPTETKTCRLCGAEQPDAGRPVPEGFMRVKNRKIVRIHNALNNLSQRRLSKDSERKVVPLMRRYVGPYHDDYEMMKDRALRAIELPEGLTSDELPAAVIEARNRAAEDVLNDTQDIPTIPRHLYLTDADMPLGVKKKDELDAAMQTGVAKIKADLDFLYIGDDDDNDDEEEG